MQTHEDIVNCILSFFMSFRKIMFKSALKIELFEFEGCLEQIKLPSLLFFLIKRLEMEAGSVLDTLQIQILIQIQISLL